VVGNMTGCGVGTDSSVVCWGSGETAPPL
jgi:hypothetical protein